jgi:vacuolar-type H+-ATPase subunit C/Vma6
MLRTSRYSYILAKIYGMRAKSYIGGKFNEILRIRKIEDLHDLLFPGERGDLSEFALTSDLERKATRAAITSMIKVLELLKDPQPLLSHLLRKYEYQSVKAVVRFLVVSGREPSIWDIGNHGTVHLEGSRDFRQSIRKSPYAWVLPLLSTTTTARIENLLDREYYLTLHALVQKLPARDRAGVSRLISLESSLTSVLWALRLRFFFGFEAENARDFLFPRIHGVGHRAVLRAFDIPAESIEGWRAWKFGWLLEDQLNDDFQAPDPVRAENTATRRLFAMARALFHQDSFSLTPIVAFFKLKEYEAGLLSTAAEALRFAVPEGDVLLLAGAE